MAGLTLELVLLLVLILANGLLAMSEIAIASARKARLRSWAEEGSQGAAAALDLANHPNRFLSTVQIGITLVGIMAGALGGARIVDAVSPLLETAGLAPGYADAAALSVVVAAITFLTVVLGELVPKRIALDNAEAISARVAGPMTLMARIAGPIVWLLSAATDLVLRLAGRKTPPDAGTTEEEILAILAQAAERGVIETREQRIVERLFRLSDHTVAEIMTPRQRIVYLDLEHGAELTIRQIESEVHGRYPVCRGGLDATIGFVSVHDLLVRSMKGMPLLDAAAVADPHWVTVDFPALRLLHLFQASGVHMAVVRAASGRVRGIVTLTDLLERVVGELPELGELGDGPIIEREDGSWLVDPSVTVAELWQALPEVARGRFRREAAGTVADLITSRAQGPIGPAAGVVVDGLRFEVVDMDGPRIDKVLVSYRRDW